MDRSRQNSASSSNCWQGKEAHVCNSADHFKAQTERHWSHRNGTDDLPHRLNLEETCFFAYTYPLLNIFWTLLVFAGLASGD